MKGWSWWTSTKKALFVLGTYLLGVIASTPDEVFAGAIGVSFPAEVAVPLTGVVLFIAKFGRNAWKNKDNGQVAALVLCALLPSFAWAQLLPKEASTDFNSLPTTVDVTAGVLATMVGGDRSSGPEEAKAAITPTSYVEVEGPVPFGDSVWTRGFTRLGLSSNPGEQAAITNVETWKALDGAIGIHKIVGRAGSDSQRLTTGIVAEWGFSSKTGAPEPDKRLSRHFGAGVRLREWNSGAEITAIYGRDEAAGDWRYGQLMLYGSLPLAFTEDVVTLVGDVTVSVGPKDGFANRDIVRFGTVVDLGALLGALKK